MNNLEDKKKNRFRFLHHLYKISDGNEMSFQKQYEIGENLNFCKEEVDSITRYLKEEGLIKYIADPDLIAITHYGVINVEEALTEPNKSTHYFPPAVNFIQIQNMHGSQIQQGTINSSQTMVTSVENINTLKEFIIKLKKELPEIQLKPDDYTEMESEIETIEAQLKSTRPKKNILKESAMTIKRILEGAVGSAIAAGLIKLLSGIF